MLVRLGRTVITSVAAAMLITSAAWCQETKKNWKDRGEYDLYAAITKEASAAKKIELLDTWKEKYPETDFKQERLQLYLTAYQAANQPVKMVETANQMLALNPKDVQALYWICTLATTHANPTEQDFGTAEKAANTLLGVVPETFAADKRPQSTSEADWTKARNDMGALAHKTLGWVAMQRKNNAKAEEHFQQSLELNAAAGEVSYWLGTVVIAQKNPDKSSRAIFHIARAASYDGAGALNPQGRQQVEAYLKKLYTQFHGSSEGLEELRQLVRSQALPPADFKVKSAAEVALEKEEQLKRENPQLALWLSIRRELTGPNGATYWETMKGALLPGKAVEGVTKLKGVLAEQKPAKNPKEIVLTMSDGLAPGVTLVLEEPLRGAAPEGTEVQFEGVATKFTAEPFMVTFEVENDKLEGWPAPEPPAKKAPLRKKK